MKRIQIYPSTELDICLESEAKKKGVSISALVTDILNTHYELIPSTSLSLTEITKKVYDEVEAYVSTHPVNVPFDLLSASETFAKIEMVSKGKPSAIRARIGKSFSQQIGSYPFDNIEVARKPDNTPIKSPKNNALMYKKILSEGR